MWGVGNLKRAFRELIGKGRNSSLTNVYSVGTNEVYVHIDTEKAIDEGYNGNTAVFSILQKDAQKFASIPAYVYKKDSDSKEKVDNDLSKLLDRPNEYQGQDAFRETVRLYRKLTGESFIWLNRGVLADGIEGEARLKLPVLEMYVLPSCNVILVPDPKNVFGILGYKFDTGGERIPVPKEDIIHWKSSSLDFDTATRSHLRGFSPLSAGYKTLQQNNSATDAAVRMYQNDGAKGALYNETNDLLDPVQKQNVKDLINRKINNIDVKSAVANLPGKWGYLDFGKSNTDLGLLEGKNLSMKELCFLFEVPFAFFDPNMPWADQQNSIRNWVSNFIIPACKQYDDELNRVLLKAFNLEGVAGIKSDFSELPELQEALKLKIESMMKGPFRPNDILELQGYEKDPNPIMDEVWMPSGSEPISMKGDSAESITRQLEEQGLNDS